MSVDITNINKQYFLEKKVPYDEQIKKIRSSIATYEKFHADHKKRVDKFIKESVKEELHIKLKIKELKSELKLRGEIP